MSPQAHSLKIVMCEALPWGATTKVGSHHYAETLAKMGHEVFWLSHDLHVGGILRGKHRTKDYPFRNTQTVGPENRVTLWHPTVPLPFRKHRLFDNSAVAKLNARSARRTIRKVMHQSGFSQPDILWLSQSYSAYLGHSAITAKTTFFRMSDNAASFEEFPKTYRQLEASLLKSVDTIGLSSPNLRNFIPDQYSKKVFDCPNGADLSLFKTDKVPNTTSRRRVVFTGTLGSWLDYDLINYLVEKHPEDDFKIYGPITDESKRLIPRSNLQCLGGFHYDTLPEILANADIGIIPFKLDNEIARYANPLKAWEYLAAAVPVVATDLPCFSGVQHIQTARTKEAFSEALREPFTTEPAELRKSVERYDWHSLTAALLERICNA